MPAGGEGGGVGPLRMGDESGGVGVLAGCVGVTARDEGGVGTWLAGGEGGGVCVDESAAVERGAGELVEVSGGRSENGADLPRSTGDFWREKGLGRLGNFEEGDAC